MKRGAPPRSPPPALRSAPGHRRSRHRTPHRPRARTRAPPSSTASPGAAKESPASGVAAHAGLGGLRRSAWRPARRVRVAARRAHPVAPDAERFARAPVARLTRHRIAPGGGPVLVGPARAGAHPARWVRVSRGWRRRLEALLAVALGAGARRVTRGAQPRIAPRFLGVSSEEAGSMHPGRKRIRERHALGRDRIEIARVTARALALGVTVRAKGRVGRGLLPVLA